MNLISENFLLFFFRRRYWKKALQFWYNHCRYIPGRVSFILLSLILLSGLFLLTGCKKTKEVKIINTKFSDDNTSVSDRMAQVPTEFAPPLKDVVDGAEQDPQKILNKMVATYAKCKVYWDNAHIEAVYEKKIGENVKKYVDRWPCSLVFQKPAQIQLKINDGRLYSDGKKMYGFIHQGNTYSNICLEKDAPNLIASVKDLYPDACLASAMHLKIPSHFFWVPPQIVLMLARKPLNTFLPTNAELKLLDPACADSKHQDLKSPDAELCDRIEVQTENVKRILWISRTNNTLVRIQFPIESISVEENVERMVRLTLEIPERRISDNPKDFVIKPSEFSPEVGENISPDVFKNFTKVDKFPTVSLFFLKHSFPNINLRPLVSGFSNVNPANTKGKCYVLFFWNYMNFLSHTDSIQNIPPNTTKEQDNTPEDENKRICQEFMWDIERIMKKTEENPAIEFCSVCVANPQRYSDGEIRRLYGELKCTLPLYCLNQEAIKDTLLNRLSYPSLLLVGSDGIIQKHYRASSSMLLQPQVLPQLENILAGKNVYDEEYVRYETNLRRFTINMESSDVNDLYRTTPDPSIQEGASEWLPRRLPDTLKLKEWWHLDSLPDASNPLPLVKQNKSSIVDEESNQDLLVIPCEGSKLAVISAKGQLLKKINPNIPGAEESVTFVRTAVLSNGKRYFIASSLVESKKLQRYDGNFKYQGVVDLSRTREQLVTDIRLIDINNDGDSDLLISLIGDSKNTPPLVQGVYAVDEKTKKVLWQDESLKLPYQIGIYTTEKGSRWLLALNQPDTTKGNIVVNDLKTGKRIKEITADQNMSIVWFGYGQNPDGKMTSLVAFLEQVDPYQFYLAGLSPEDGKILWRAPLTQLNRNRQIERVAFGDLNGDGKGEWLVPLADGTILFFDANGKCFDRFQYGRELTGLCIAQWQSGRFLVITDSKGVTAWKIE